MVRILNKEQKLQIIKWYRSKELTQQELAVQFGVSNRTIHRVLIECGIATPVARIKGEAYKVMQILKQHDISIDELEPIIVLGKKTKKDIEDEYTYERTYSESMEFEDCPF